MATSHGTHTGDGVSAVAPNIIISVRDYGASKAFYQNLYGDHPYASPSNGTEESIEAMTIAERMETAQPLAISAGMSRTARTGSEVSPAPVQTMAAKPVISVVNIVRVFLMGLYRNSVKREAYSVPGVTTAEISFFYSRLCHDRRTLTGLTVVPEIRIFLRLRHFRDCAALRQLSGHLTLLALLP